MKKKNKEALMQKLMDQLSQLKLPTFIENLQKIVDETPQSKEAILKALRDLSAAEITQRKERNVAYRIEDAKFQQIQTVDTFNFNYNPSTQKLKNRYLKLFDADITTQGLCVLFVGSSGLGKTHLARALGYHLCQCAQRVLFSTISHMAVDLTTADSTGVLKKAFGHYTKPALLILDEVGYVSLREPESNLVFQIISQRHDKRRSTIVTTNKSFGEWNQIFHNDAMAHAIVDRLAERSEVFHLEGKSYRETHRERMKS
jgi:DNA replication protein DnaC